MKKKEEWDKKKSDCVKQEVKNKIRWLMRDWKKIKCKEKNVKMKKERKDSEVTKKFPIKWRKSIK